MLKLKNTISILSIILSILILSILNFGTSLAKGNRSHHWLIIKSDDLSLNPHNLNHFNNFAKYAKGYNLKVLEAVDSVQSHALDGGGYFIGVDSTPAESPIGYNLKLFGSSLIDPPRTTSYCSGSSYTAFITALDFILPNGKKKLSKERLEALRMQEPNGGRRDDWIKYWGIWNADGFGSQFALVQYSPNGY